MKLAAESGVTGASLRLSVYVTGLAITLSAVAISDVAPGATARVDFGLPS
jgi:hypothetical protein